MIMHTVRHGRYSYTSVGNGAWAVRRGDQLIGITQKNPYSGTWNAAPTDSAGHLPSYPTGDVSKCPGSRVGFTSRRDTAVWLDGWASARFYMINGLERRDLTACTHNN